MVTNRKTLNKRSWEKLPAFKPNHAIIKMLAIILTKLKPTKIRVPIPKPIILFLKSIPKLDKTADQTRDISNKPVQR